MILVDTSVWVRHLRATDSRLVRLLRDRRVVSCEIVLGELLLSSGLPAGVEADIVLLPKIPSPSAAETISYVRRHQRAFRAAGAGWADAEIIVSAGAAGALLYTADRAQRAVWRALGFRQV